MKELSLTDYRKHEYTPSQVFGREKKAETIKQAIISVYDEVFKYFMPDKNNFYKEVNESYESDRTELACSLGEDCSNSYVNNLQSMMSPPQSDIMDLEAGAMYAKVAESFGVSKDALNAELAKTNRFANEVKNNLTNFDIAFSEAGYDLFAGTCCILINKGNRRNPIDVRAISIADFSILEGADGEVSDVFRRLKKTATEIKDLWGEDIEVECDMDKDGSELDIELLETSYYDSKELDYVYAIYRVSDKKQLLVNRRKTSPFTVFRWNKPTGEVWGRGVGIMALNDMKTFNELVMDSLKASAFETPMFEVDDGGLFNVDEIELEGGALIGIPSTDTGEGRIKQINVNTGRENSRIDMERLELSIRRTCFADKLPDSATGQGKTATEINEIVRSLNKNYTSVYGRLIRGQQNLIRSFYDVLGQAGLLNDSALKPLIDTDRINGLWFACNLNTPLTKMLSYNEINSMINVMTMLVQLDPSGRTLAKTIKLNEANVRIADRAGFPIDLIYTPEEIAGNEQAMMKADQQAQIQERNLNVQEQNAIERGKIQ